MRQLRNSHIVTGHSQQKWIAEYKIGVGNLADEVVADAERQAEPVKTICSEHGQVMWPHLAIVEPWFIFYVAGEQPGYATNSIARPLDDRLLDSERGGGCTVLHTIG